MLTPEIMKAQLGALQASMKPESMQGFYDHAERWFRDEVGRELWDHLAALDSTTTAGGELLRLTHSCVAWQAYTLAFPHQKFRVGELGMMKSSPQNAVAVTKWEYVDSRDANLSMLDLSLEYFWREVEHQRPAAWTASDAYTERNRHFIRSAAELGKLLPIAGRNYRVFQKIVPYIEEVEEDAIRSTLTTTVYTDLKQKWQNPATVWTPVEMSLLPLIRKALAYLSVYEAFPYLPLEIDELGISEKRSKDGTSEAVAPDANLRQGLRSQLYTDGQKRLSKVRQCLDETASPTQFAEYYAKYVAGGSADNDAFDDFTNKPHVIL